MWQHDSHEIQQVTHKLLLIFVVWHHSLVDRCSFEKYLHTIQPTKRKAVLRAALEHLYQYFCRYVFVVVDGPPFHHVIRHDPISQVPQQICLVGYDVSQLRTAIQQTLDNTEGAIYRLVLVHIVLIQPSDILQKQPKELLVLRRIQAVSEMPFINLLILDFQGEELAEHFHRLPDNYFVGVLQQHHQYPH